MRECGQGRGNNDGRAVFPMRLALSLSVAVGKSTSVSHRFPSSSLLSFAALMSHGICALFLLYGIVCPDAPCFGLSHKTVCIQLQSRSSTVLWPSRLARHVSYCYGNEYGSFHDAPWISFWKLGVCVRHRSSPRAAQPTAKKGHNESALEEHGDFS
jgi:hypothetical protein